MAEQDKLAQQIESLCAENGLHRLAWHFLGDTACTGDALQHLPWDTYIHGPAYIQGQRGPDAVQAMVKGTAEDRARAGRTYQTLICCPMDGTAEQSSEEQVLYNDACWDLYLDRTLSWVNTPIAWGGQKLSSLELSSTHVFDFVLTVFAKKLRTKVPFRPEDIAGPSNLIIEFVSKDVALVVWSPDWAVTLEVLPNISMRPTWIVGPTIYPDGARHFAFLAINLQDAKILILDPLHPNPKHQATSDDVPEWLTENLLFKNVSGNNQYFVGALFFLCVFGLHGLLLPPLVLYV